MDQLKEVEPPERLVAVTDVQGLESSPGQQDGQQPCGSLDD